jgi:hypothetical protein
MRMLERCLAVWSPHGTAYSAPRPAGWALGLTLVLLTASTAAAQVTLAWNPSPSAGVDGYRVYYGTQSRIYTASLDAGPTTTATVTGLSSGQTYYFAVTAYDRTDGSESSVSNEVSTTLPPVEVPGLVAAYSFDEGHGTTVIDASGQDNHGTITGATWTLQGRFGSALDFDGLSALVTIPDAPSLRLTTAMTLEAWVKPSTVTSAWWDVIYKGNDNYFLEATAPTGDGVPAGGGTFDANDVVMYGAAPLAVSSWTHLALTYDGATLRLYVNGVQVASQAQTGSLVTSANPLQIGGDSIFGQYFQGTIDEVRIYNQALSPSEIQADMGTPIQ